MTPESPRYVVRKQRVDIQQLQHGMQRVPQVLAKLGFKDLRPGQDKVISCIMAGQDTLGILPTSTGKTACFVVPTLALGWRTIVFSPLISLIRDQQQSLAAKGVRVGAMTSHVSDSLNMEYMRQWMRGDLDMLYIAPERLRKDEFLEAMRKMPPDLVAVDETHCLSGWSDTFRSAYCIIGDFITELNPKVVAAFTATCPPQVERDVRRVLCIENAVKAIHYPRRTNLDLRSSPWVDTVSMLTMLNRAEASSSDGTSIIYCATKKRVEETASALESLLGRPTVFYHGGMTKSARSFVQDQFMQGDARVLVATNAFGMGVDKATVRLVMHRDIAGSMEAQFQEDGRGGRDGKYTLCHTFFDSSSVRTHRFLIGLSCPTFAEVQLIYKALRTHASSSGVINMTHEEIAKKAGLEAPRMSAILQVLAGSQVIERSKATEKLYALKVLNQVEDRRLTEIMDVVRSFGIPGDDGYWDIPLHTLVDEIGCSDNTMRTRLNAFAKAGVMGVVAPERTSPVKLIGDIRQVDGERVDMLRQIAETKLAGSIQYADKVPDAEKHAYMEAHMGINAT